MNSILRFFALATGVFGGMVVCLEVGYRLGRRGFAKHAEKFAEGTGTIEAAVFALLGLLLAFTFSGSMSRLETRRQQIIREANAIGTAYLRLDLLPAAEQPALRRLFREYVDTRLRAYEKLPQRAAAQQDLEKAAGMQRQIWAGAVAASLVEPAQPPVRMLLLPALNEMIDITTERTIALDTHLPTLIFLLLVCVAFLSAVVAGHAMARRTPRSLLHMYLYAAIVAITIYTMLDLDHPRAGLIRLDAADKALLQVRDSIQ